MAARVLALAALILAACFSVPEYDDGELRCGGGSSCPPGFTCSTGLCRRSSTGPGVDAPLALDATPRDAGARDASAVDARVSYDAPPCTENDRRCAGELQVCVGGVFIAAVPSCASQSQTCFDPGAPGGSDAYCGDCLKGARRCVQGAPPKVQGCPASGLWTDETPCNAGFGCVDLDGEMGPAAYCGECPTGDNRCTGSTFGACIDSRWMDMPCPMSCFDPTPGGGSDAYCGACQKDEVVCHGDNLDQCASDGSGYGTVTACEWGCNPATLACCGLPDCGDQVCGGATNECGKSRSCGTCSSGNCCLVICCPATRFCCPDGSCSLAGGDCPLPQ